MSIITNVLHELKAYDYITFHADFLFPR